MRIAVLGAPATGKSQLSQTLAQHLGDAEVCDAPATDTLRPGAYAHVLLMGLDLPGTTPAQQQADTAMRTQLAAIGVGYGVVYGHGPQRLHAALRLIAPQDGPAPRWRGLCEKCADPECEFRLFSALKSGA